MTNAMTNAMIAGDLVISSHHRDSSTSSGFHVLLSRSESRVGVHVQSNCYCAGWFGVIQTQKCPIGPEESPFSRHQYIFFEFPGNHESAAN